MVTINRLMRTSRDPNQTREDRLSPYNGATIVASASYGKVLEYGRGWARSGVVIPSRIRMADPHTHDAHLRGMTIRCRKGTFRVSKLVSAGSAVFVRCVLQCVSTFCEKAVSERVCAFQRTRIAPRAPQRHMYNMYSMFSHRLKPLLVLWRKVAQSRPARSVRRTPGPMPSTVACRAS